MNDIDKKDSIWIAEWGDEESYDRVGLFKSQLDAFISCLNHWKYSMMNDVDYYRKKYKVEKKEWYRYHFLDHFHNLQRYYIYEENINESFLTKEDIEKR